MNILITFLTKNDVNYNDVVNSIKELLELTHEIYELRTIDKMKYNEIINLMRYLNNNIFINLKNYYVHNSFSSKNYQDQSFPYYEHIKVIDENNLTIAILIVEIWNDNYQMNFVEFSDDFECCTFYDNEMALTKYYDNVHIDHCEIVDVTGNKPTITWTNEL
jgi:hypothetical protein